MSLTITPSLANADPNTPNPSTVQGLIDILNPLFEDSEVDSSNTFVTSSSTPAVSDQDRAWLKTDSAGRPLGIFIFYNGNWRKFYNGNYGEVKLFIGNPTDFFENGVGKIGTDWDGWSLMDGTASSFNWSDKFIVGGRMDNENSVTGWSGSTWQSSVGGSAQSEGGNPNYSLINNNLPAMKVQLQGKAGYDDDDEDPADDPLAIVTGKYYGGNKTVDVATFGADPSGTPAVAQVPIPTVPPFAVVAYCIWVGYS